MATLRALIFAVIVAVPACGGSGVHTFLGCDWDLGDLEMRGDGTFFYIDIEPPINPSIDFRFFDRSFNEPDTGFVLVRSENIGLDVVVSRYSSTEDTPLSGVDLYVLQRAGYDGYVEILNASYAQFLRSCQ